MIFIIGTVPKTSHPNFLSMKYVTVGNVLPLKTIETKTIVISSVMQCPKEGGQRKRVENRLSRCSLMVGKLLVIVASAYQC